MTNQNSEENLDKRSRRSRKWLKDALKDLLNEKAFDDISVTDISAKADVSRFTFYKHYENKEALLLNIVEDIFDQMYKQVDIDRANQFFEGENSNTDDIFQNLLFSRNKDTERVLKLGLDRFSQTILISMESRGRDKLRKLPLSKKLSKEDDSSLQIFNIFLTGGTLALLSLWLSKELPHDGETMNKIVAMFAQILIKEGLLSGNINRLLNRKES